MWQRHNAQLANFDVTSLRVTATATTQEADVQVVCDEATRKAMIAAREQFLKDAAGAAKRSSLLASDSPRVMVVRTSWRSAAARCHNKLLYAGR
jgi:hypothetical protein